MKKHKLAAKAPSKRETTDEKTAREFLKLGERIKQLRMKNGHISYEIFASTVLNLADMSAENIFDIAV